MYELRAKIEARILERAMKDEAFRNRLTDNPKEAIEDELGIQLPGSLNVHIHKESPNDIHISLPLTEKELPGSELTGKQLEGVSGGWNGPNETGIKLPRFLEF